MRVEHCVGGRQDAPPPTFENVLFPEPFFPIMACTSPSLSVRSTPFSICCPVAAILASSPLTSNKTSPAALRTTCARLDRGAFAVFTLIKGSLFPEKHPAGRIVLR